MQEDIEIFVDGYSFEREVDTVYDCGRPVHCTYGRTRSELRGVVGDDHELCLPVSPELGQAVMALSELNKRHPTRSGRQIKLVLSVKSLKLE